MNNDEPTTTPRQAANLLRCMLYVDQNVTVHSNVPVPVYSYSFFPESQWTVRRVDDDIDYIVDHVRVTRYDYHLLRTKEQWYRRVPNCPVISSTTTTTTTTTNSNSSEEEAGATAAAAATTTGRHNHFVLRFGEEEHCYEICNPVVIPDELIDERCLGRVGKLSNRHQPTFMHVFAYRRSVIPVVPAPPRTPDE